MNRQTPHPFPGRLAAQTNFDLRDAGITDSNARFIIRRAIANAYAEGYDDGTSTQYLNAIDDRQAREDAEAAKEPTDR